ncbi:MAG TPA: phosphatase PAP2 family protein [Kofleriaceae bacterium]|nr:phosphatase PAP2 family protein [Kofleriaceae bacterium]
MPSPRFVLALAAAIVCPLATPALADDVIPGHTVDRPVDGAIIAGALGAGLGLSLIPVRVPPTLWARELFGDADGAVHARFSPRAAQISDGLLAATIAAPLTYLVGDTVEDADGDRLVLYGESLAVNLAVFEGAKHLVRRPRPYLYSTSPAVARYAAAQGDDAYQSFYSAHAATAFCAATTGAYLAAVSAPRMVRRIAWTGGFATAAAVANLRVRAGKHFYSDVVIGAAVGIAIGYAVPALHADGAAYVPSLGDAGAAAAGLIGGTLLSELVPLERGHASPLPSARRGSANGRAGQPELARFRRPGRLARLAAFAARRRAHVHLGPVPVTGGAGVGIAGAM